MPRESKFFRGIDERRAAREQQRRAQGTAASQSWADSMAELERLREQGERQREAAQAYYDESDIGGLIEGLLGELYQEGRYENVGRIGWGEFSPANGVLDGLQWERVNGASLAGRIKRSVGSPWRTGTHYEFGTEVTPTGLIIVRFASKKELPHGRWSGNPVVIESALETAFKNPSVSPIIDPNIDDSGDSGGNRGNIELGIIG